MKVGFDAKRLYCNFTGLGNYSRTLVKNLLQYGNGEELQLYTPKIIDNEETAFFLNHPDLKTFKPSGAFGSLWRTYGLSKQIQKDKLDIYHGLSHELPVGIKRSGVKSVVTIHDLIFKVYPKTYPAFDRAVYERKFRYSCENADCVLAISESTKRDIIHYYGIDESKIKVLYQSINPLYFQESDEAFNQRVKESHHLPEDFILYVGSVEERKNLKILIEAMHRLPSTMDIPLVVVGKGTAYKQEVETLIAHYKLGDRVIWLNRLESNLQLKALYEMAKVFVYPSVYEGFGLPVAEAILSRTAVITSNVSSLPEAAGPYATCIDPRNADELCNALLTLLNDSEKRTSVEEKSYHYAQQNFNAEKLTMELIHLYESLY